MQNFVAPVESFITLVQRDSEIKQHFGLIDVPVV